MILTKQLTYLKKVNKAKHIFQLFFLFDKYVYKNNKLLIG